MRIIAGRCKGRRLKTVKGGDVRSTADRVKESLFNILAADIPGRAVCDLFCGAGTLGLEALSRGATRVVFVDSRRRSIRCTEENIALIGAQEATLVLNADARAALHKLKGWGARFSLIFADPPYGKGWPARMLEAVAQSGCRDKTGILVIEHHKKDLPGNDPPGFLLLTSRRFGDTVLSIWHWENLLEEDSSDLPEAGHEAEVADE